MDLLPSRIARPFAAALLACGLLAAPRLAPVAQAQGDASATPEPPASEPAPIVPSAPPAPPVMIQPPPFQTMRPMQPAPALGVKGKVLAVHDLSATISIGARDGVTPGARILFIARALHPDDPFAADTTQPQVVGEVYNVTEDAALVSLGLLESVSEGQQVEVTARRPSARRLAPPRPPATVIVEGGLRPFLPIRRVSIGAFADLALTYLPAIPIFVRAELLPAAGRVGAGSDMGALGGLLSVGYDQRYVAIGLGAGILYHRDFVEDGSSERLGRAQPRFQFAQLLRAGARDGLHVSVKTAFALASERWRLASFTIAGQIPIATRLALAPRILVGPNAGVFLAEMGVRLLARGDGGPGSLFLRPVAGISGTFDGDKNSWDSYEKSIDGAMNKMLFGPMIGIDLEFRL